MYKVCFKCGEEKALSEFYKHPRMNDGHVNKCKECNKNDVKKNRSKKIDYYREYDKERGNRQTAEYKAEYKKRFPNKIRAHRMVDYRISKGIFIPQPCENCGSNNNIVAHHDDYSRPLEIRWMCQACHVKWHQENGSGLNP